MSTENTQPSGRHPEQLTPEQIEEIYGDDIRYCSGHDYLEAPSPERLASVREGIVQLELAIREVLPVNRWTSLEVRNRAVDFLGAIALEFLTTGHSCNANLLRVEDRLLNCRALVETNVRGELA